jgi:hypothetical protein
MSFNIFRVQFAPSLRTFGIRCLPSFKNKSTLIITKRPVVANAKLITSLSSNNNANKILFRRQFNTNTPSHKNNSNLVEREKAKEWSKMTTGQKGTHTLELNISFY